MNRKLNYPSSLMFDSNAINVILDYRVCKQGNN